ncbi:hypothetical protein GLYMA_13G043200v4 [Glycine max]|nr:hypothetical protein GLYMA_13G043200v4 [Glycine max]KAH1099781.1 hypothetical protein GYH30_035106 [Glycine max]
MLITTQLLLLYITWIQLKLYHFIRIHQTSFICCLSSSVTTSMQHQGIQCI